MIPVPFVAAWGWLRSRAKARADRLRDRAEAYRYQPPAISFRGIGKVVLVLIATHYFVHWRATRNALADFAEQARQLEIKVKAEDAKKIARLEDDLRRAREAENEAIEYAKKADEQALREIEEILKRTKVAGWNREIVDLINGDKPQKASKRKAKR